MDDAYPIAERELPNGANVLRPRPALSQTANILAPETEDCEGPIADVRIIRRSIHPNGASKQHKTVNPSHLESRTPQAKLRACLGEVRPSVAAERQEHYRRNQLDQSEHQ